MILFAFRNRRTSMVVFKRNHLTVLAALINSCTESVKQTIISLMSRCKAKSNLHFLALLRRKRVRSLWAPSLHHYAQ